MAACGGCHSGRGNASYCFQRFRLCNQWNPAPKPCLPTNCDAVVTAQGTASQAAEKAKNNQETIYEKAKRAFGGAASQADTTASQAQKESETTWQKVRAVLAW